MKNIESTVVELGAIFQQLAHMVKEQEEMVQRSVSWVASGSVWFCLVLSGSGSMGSWSRGQARIGLCDRDYGVTGAASQGTGGWSRGA